MLRSVDNKLLINFSRKTIGPRLSRNVGNNLPINGV